MDQKPLQLFTALNTGHSGMGTLHAPTHCPRNYHPSNNSPMNVPNIMIPALDFREIIYAEPECIELRNGGNLIRQ